MTGNEIEQIKRSLPRFDQRSEEDEKLYKELSCREMINSILIYGYLDSSIDNIFNDKYLDDYKKDISESRIKELIKEQQDDLKKSKIIKNSHTDSEGVTYNSVYWYDNNELEESKQIIEAVNPNSDITYYIDSLNKLKDSYKYGHGSEDKEIEQEVKRLLDEMSNGSTMYRVNRETSSGWTSYGSYSDEYTKLIAFTKDGGNWKYDGRQTKDTSDAMLSVLFNSGDFMTREAAEELKKDMEKDDKSYHRDIVNIGTDKWGNPVGKSTNRVTNRIKEETKELRRYNSRLYGIYDTEKQEYIDTGSLEDMKKEVATEKEDIEENQEKKEKEDRDININVTVKNENKENVSFEDIVLDSYNHLFNELGKDKITIYDLLDDIIHNYEQDYIKDDTFEDTDSAYKSIRYVLNHNNIEYELDENKAVKGENFETDLEQAKEDSKEKGLYSEDKTVKARIINKKLKKEDIDKENTSEESNKIQQDNELHTKWITYLKSKIKEDCNSDGYYEVYWDYNDELDPDAIQQIVNNAVSGDISLVAAADDYLWDLNSGEALDEYFIDDVREYIPEELEDYASDRDLFDDLDEAGYYGIDMNAQELLDKSEVKVNIIFATPNESNYDMSSIVDVFGSWKDPAYDYIVNNPEILDNAMTYLIHQQGHSLKDYYQCLLKNPNGFGFDHSDNFIESCVNDCVNNSSDAMSGICCLTTLTPDELYELEKAVKSKTGSLEFSKDTYCGTVNIWAGSGGLSISLEKPLIIPTSYVHTIQVEGAKNNNGYTVDEIFGLVGECWDGKMTLTNSQPSLYKENEEELLNYIKTLISKTKNDEEQ